MKKRIEMKTWICILITAILFVGCNLFKKQPAAYTPIKGTSWVYVDADWIYDITFEEGGKLRSKHPNDITPDNDFWKQSGVKVNFEFNKGYTKYQGEMQTKDLITGIATNEAKQTWKWELRRKK